MSKYANEQINTPAGVAVYPRLNEPDYKFDPAGQFSVTVRVGAEEGQKLKDKLDAKPFFSPNWPPSERIRL